MSSPIWAATVLAIYLVPFFLLGWLVKRLADHWMSRRGLDGGPGALGRTGRMRRFLLGVWYDD